MGVGAISNKFEGWTGSRPWKVCSLGITASDRGVRVIQYGLLGAALLFPQLQASPKMRSLLASCAMTRSVGSLFFCARDYIELTGGRRFDKERFFDNASDGSSLVSTVFTPFVVAYEFGLLPEGRWLKPALLLATLGGIGEPTCSHIAALPKPCLKGGEPPNSRNCALATIFGLEALCQLLEATSFLSARCMVALGVLSGTFSMGLHCVETVQEWR